MTDFAATHVACGGQVLFHTCESGGGTHHDTVASECLRCGYQQFENFCPECGLDAAPPYIKRSA